MSVGVARERLEQIAAIQPETLEMFRNHGIVFDEAPSTEPDPRNWQHVAFSLYTRICEADSIARLALAQMDEE